MSQDGSRQQTNSDLSDEPVLVKHYLVKTNTSDLIDQLFLAQSLNQSVPLPPDPKPAIRDTLQPVYQPGTVILVFRTLVQSLRVVPYRQRAYVASTRRLSPPSSEQTYQSDLFSSQPINNRFFLCLACASVAMTLLLWAASQVKFSTDNVAPPVLAAPQGSSSPTVGAAEIQSTAPEPYPQSVEPGKSPQLVGQLVEPEKLPQPVDQGIEPAPSTTAIQPTKVSLPANTQVVPANTVIPVPARAKPERIFVPVYQPSPAQPVAAKPQTTYRAAVASASIPSVSTSSIAASTHTLVGVMEFGDRSAALIDINHVIRRIRIGETLTPDGWKLTKVTDQKAVLQRGGKLRSIYVGQKF